MDSRQAWDVFRQRFRQLEAEFLRGLNELLGRFNVSGRSERFVVGDVTEYLLAASFFSLGILILPRGANQNNFDLDALVGELRMRFSVKSTYSRSASDMRIKNKLSGEARGSWTWDEPVLFVVRELGLVYADPTVHTDLAAELTETSDAHVLKLNAVRRHVERNPDCLIATTIPINPGTGRESASRTIFKDIFDHPAYPVLGGFLQRIRATVEGTPVFEALDEARSRHERGELTDEQYQALVEALIGRIGERQP